MKKTNLKKLLYVPLLYGLLISSSFSAEPYLEGQVGMASVEDANGDTLVRTGGFNVAVSVDDLSFQWYNDGNLLIGETAQNIFTNFLTMFRV
mgnify:CR=1 FL=1